MASSLHADPYRALVDLLVETRKSAGVTQVQLGERLQKPQSYVSKIERGERRIDLIEFTEWVEAIGVKPPKVYETLLSRLAETSKSA